MLTHVDARVRQEDALLISGPDRIKLAVFATNLNGGPPTLAEGRLKATWDESTRIAKAAEAAGLDAMISVGRWKGVNSPSQHHMRSFESLAYVAGIAAITERMQVLATVHVPTIHPVRLAKELTTIDHISGGRVGLNVVAGWNKPEIEMFGAPLREHEERYEVGEEWLKLLRLLWTSETEFDFNGKYFQSPGALSLPLPLQDPYPLVMSAGMSPRGRDWAMRNADILFTMSSDLEATRRDVAEIKATARERYNRDVKVWYMADIVCRDTEREAQEYVDYYVGLGDREAILPRMNHYRAQYPEWTEEELEIRARNLLKGTDGVFFQGTPEQITEQMLEVVDAGVDGLAVTWLDYEDGIARYHRDLLPLFVEAGLREPLQGER